MLLPFLIKSCTKREEEKKASNITAINHCLGDTDTVDESVRVYMLRMY